MDEKRASELANALLKLVEQIEMGTYRDELGHDLKMNIHFVAAKKLCDPPKFE